ncbi:MAG: NUDIX domain-containing protein [Anaerolineae bacterium]|nr:NUDIX domain-containing protein [Anaerolineae bacterium]
MPASDQGVFPDRYMLIPRVLIFVTREENVLLLKGAPNKRLWANLYNGVGGHVERGEDVLSAAKRELEEETNLSGIDLWLCATIAIDTNEEIGIGMYVFRGEWEDGEAISSDEGTLEWVSIGELESLPLVEDLPTLLPRLLAMEREDNPLSVHYSYSTSGELILRFGE